MEFNNKNYVLIKLQNCTAVLLRNIKQESNLIPLVLDFWNLNFLLGFIYMCL